MPTLVATIVVISIQATPGTIAPEAIKRLPAMRIEKPHAMTLDESIRSPR